MSVTVKECFYSLSEPDGYLMHNLFDWFKARETSKRPWPVSRKETSFANFPSTTLGAKSRLFINMRGLAPY